MIFSLSALFSGQAFAPAGDLPRLLIARADNPPAAARSVRSPRVRH
jgi:hypothetical protein